MTTEKMAINVSMFLILDKLYSFKISGIFIILLN